MAFEVTSVPFIVNLEFATRVGGALPDARDRGIGRHAFSNHRLNGAHVRQRAKQRLVEQFVAQAASERLRLEQQQPPPRTRFEMLCDDLALPFASQCSAALSDQALSVKLSFLDRL
jgi:hypothetical protein